jgi:rhodanese-related sulfurtransferase
MTLRPWRVEIIMSQKLVVQDLIGVWLLLTGCFIGALVVNEMRPTPLSLVYLSPKSRLNQIVQQLGSPETASVGLDGDVSRNEMQRLILNHGALILDARPEIFYQLSHIPSALSLPRDDFEKQYLALQSTLQSHHGVPLVVYCSGSDCHDSQLVADALQKLGYPHVRLFRGGWGDWEAAGLPEEKE